MKYNYKCNKRVFIIYDWGDEGIEGGLFIFGQKNCEVYDIKTKIWGLLVPHLIFSNFLRAIPFKRIWEGEDFFFRPSPPSFYIF